MTHTPTPWQLAGITTERLQGNQRSIEADFIHIEAEGYTAGGGIGMVHNKPNGVGMANAQFVIQACNAHEELVAALEECIEHLGMIPDYEKTNGDKAAIEKGLKALSSIKKGA